MQAKMFLLIYCLFILYIMWKDRDQCFDAFNCGRKEEALRLLKKIDDPRTVKDSSEFTILHCAAYHGWLSVVKKLINDHQFDPDCMDDDGNTPLMKAKSNDKQPVVDYLQTVLGTFVVYLSLCTLYNYNCLGIQYNYSVWHNL